MGPAVKDLRGIFGHCFAKVAYFDIPYDRQGELQFVADGGGEWFEFGDMTDAAINDILSDRDAVVQGFGYRPHPAYTFHVRIAVSELGRVDDLMYLASYNAQERWTTVIPVRTVSTSDGLATQYVGYIHRWNTGTPEGKIGVFPSRQCGMDEGDAVRLLHGQHAIFTALSYLLSVPAIRRTHTSPLSEREQARRARKGRAPVPGITTVYVGDYKPTPRPALAPQGGTHASPVEHTRRAHTRTRNGKTFTVRATVVNAGKGLASAQRDHYKIVHANN